MTRPHVPFVSYMLAAVLCFIMTGIALIPACSQLKAEGHDAQVSVVNCTAQALGTQPALDIATLVAIANVVATEKSGCSPGGVLDWNCVETDLIGEGEVLGGCAFAKLIATPPPAPVPSTATVTAAATLTSDTPPGRTQFERFRVSVAKGAKFHLSDGDH